MQKVNYEKEIEEWREDNSKKISPETLAYIIANITIKDLNETMKILEKWENHLGI